MNTEKVYNVNSKDDSYNRSYVSLLDILYNIPTGTNEKLNSINGSSSLSNLYDMLYIPNWDMRSFINERLKFRVQGMDGSSDSAFSEPGTYFYRLFFNFNTGYGLLGGLVYDQSNAIPIQENTAIKYLTDIIYTGPGRFSENFIEMLKKKRSSLQKFGKLLNYLSNECPWFFKEVSGIAEALKPDFEQIAPTEKKSIIITFNQDAVDMRVSSLIDLYRDACYDFRNYREVIPENLRLFDMSVLLFNPPINGMNMNVKMDEVSNQKKNLNPKVSYSPISIDNSYTEYYGITADLNDKSIINRMSYRLITFKNCQIDVKESTSVPDTITNETGFQFANTMKITFDRAYIMNFNNELNFKTTEGVY